MSTNSADYVRWMFLITLSMQSCQGPELQSVSNLPQSGGRPEGGRGSQHRQLCRPPQPNTLTPRIHCCSFSWNLFQMKWRKIKMWMVHSAGPGYNELQVGFKFPCMRCGPQLQMSLSAFTGSYSQSPFSDFRVLFHFNWAAAATAVDIAIKHLKMQKYLCACWIDGLGSITIQGLFWVQQPSNKKPHALIVSVLLTLRSYCCKLRQIQSRYQIRKRGPQRSVNMCATVDVVSC